MRQVYRSDKSATEPIQPPPLPPFTETTANPGLLRNDPARQTKTAGELAEMILADLKNMGRLPASWSQVTVHGLEPWNS
jgi:hypothetical protein